MLLLSGNGSWITSSPWQISFPARLLNREQGSWILRKCSFIWFQRDGGCESPRCVLYMLKRFTMHRLHRQNQPTTKTAPCPPCSSQFKSQQHVRVSEGLRCDSEDSFVLLLRPVMSGGWSCSRQQHFRLVHMCCCDNHPLLSSPWERTWH